MVRQLQSPRLNFLSKLSKNIKKNFHRFQGCGIVVGEKFEYDRTKQ